MRHVAKTEFEKKFAIIAPHGGKIEAGTSELCLAIAGFHPATRSKLPGFAQHNYWMFEGIRTSDNTELHVTSAHCDDPVAQEVCRNALYAVALHGCTGTSAGGNSDYEAVLVGGQSARFRRVLVGTLRAKGFEAIDAGSHATLSGTDRGNIANRTKSGSGVQLEITTALRKKMFRTNTLADRGSSLTPAFHKFVDAVRIAMREMDRL